MNTETTPPGLRKPSGWSMVWGGLMFICGLLAIALPQISSVEIVIILASLLLIAGAWHLIFAFHGHSAGGVLWQILLAVLYVTAGAYMWLHPLLSVVSLTLILAIFLALEGLIEIALYFALRRVRHAGWVLVDGVVTLILGILIWRQWPSSSTWVIGTLVGISLIFSGISRFLLSAGVRGSSPRAV